MYFPLRGKKDKKKNLIFLRYLCGADKTNGSSLNIPDTQAFNKFYFSGTMRSIEHYYPQSYPDIDGGAINCFGNLAMFGSRANSSGSNRTPKTKFDHYPDASGKISAISASSLKFMIMMKMCQLNGEWGANEKHYEVMLEVLFTGQLLITIYSIL